MDTVHLTCGHCGNLMAVEAQMMGQQVRCPHCQQVVQTPAPAAAAAPPPPPPEPAPVIFPSREEESIFTPPAQDDLFGDAKPPPTIEMPPESGWPVPSAAAPPPPGPVFHDGSPEFAPAGAAPPAPDPLAFQTTTPALDASDRTAVLPPTDWSARPSRQTPTPPEPAPSRERAPGRRTPTPIPWLEIILIPYAIAMTVLAIIFYAQRGNQRSPLEELPDDGEYRGVTQKGEKISRIQSRWRVDSSLPPKLRVPLHKTLRVGALEVTPLGVERSKLTYHYTAKGRKPEVSGKEALVLRLQLKNVSADQQFCPTDPAFDASWKDPKKPQPYTYLEVGPVRFFGGPIEYPYDKDFGRTYVQGQENDPQPLGPGQERTTVICTDPERADEVQRALARSKGPLVWRVRLRRGLVEVHHQPRSATAVIGVEFAANEIR